jgi:integrase
LRPKTLKLSSVNRELDTIKALFRKAVEMIMISLYTCFRLSEIFNLQVQDIDFNKDTISVNPKHGFIPKNYKFCLIEN